MRIRGDHLLKYSIYMPVNIEFGEGKVKLINQLCSADEKVLFICDPIIERLGIVEKIIDSLENINVSVFSDIEPNPSVHTVNKALKVARDNHISLVIGIGGGSSLDTAKAVSCVASDNGFFEEFLYGKRKIQNRVKLILVPTTAGTGSECTSVGIFTDTEKNRKEGYKTPYFFCDTAIVDPELTYSLPPIVTAMTGIDAFTHALEAYWNTNTNPMCRSVAMCACRDVLGNLLKCYTDPQNKEARSLMINASVLGGWAFGQVRTTLVHALSFPFADYFHIPHGAACALSLVAVIKYAVANDPDCLKELVRFCGYSATDDFINDVADMIDKTKILSDMPDISITHDEIKDIAEKACDLEYSHLIPGNIDVERLMDLLKNLFNK